jgi:Zn-dependent protease
MSFQPEPTEREYEPPEREYRPIHPEPGWRSLMRKIWAPIAVLIGLVVKFGFAFAKFASIFVAVGGYALLWGWQFGVGFVLLIFVHELGHFVEARRRGFNASWPVFIPFLGAYVAIRDARMNPWQNFWISFAGPAWGSVGAACVWLAGEQQGSRLLQALGSVGFLLNLFNLLPVGFLDGGSMWRSIKTMRLGGTPGKAQLATAVYIGLAALLVIGMLAAHVPQHRL